MRRLLLDQVHRVTEAGDGREAVKAYQAGRVDLVLLDMVMPEMDGVETLVALRRMDPRARVLAVSGGGSVDPSIYLDVARALGATQTLAKPFEAEDFLRAVESALKAFPGASPDAPSVAR